MATRQRSTPRPPRLRIRPISPLRPIRRFLWPALAALLVAAFACGVARYRDPVHGFTSLIQFDAASVPAALPEFRDQPVYTWPGEAGYDGLYYAQLACRPLVLDPALSAAMDHALAYRARRPLGGWIAWALSLGDTARVPFVYATVNLAAWLILALLLLKLFPLTSASHFLSWAGLLCSAGALASVRLALTDLPALVLLTAGALWLSRRPAARGPFAFFMAAPLARETALLAAPAIFERPFFTEKNLLRLALVAVPLGLWFLWCTAVLPPGGSGTAANFTWPLAGLAGKFGDAFAHLAHPGAFLALRLATLLTTLALAVQAAFLLSRPQPGDLWWRLGAAHAVLLLFLGPAVWEGEPGAAARVLLPLHLAFNVLAPRARRGLLLLVLGNLTVFSGVLQFAGTPPHEAGELSTTHVADVTTVVRLGTGWFGPEHNAHTTWSWGRGEATLAIRTWPAAAPATVRLRLRALAPRTVEIRQSGRTLWRGALTSAWRAVELRCTGGELSLHTDAPLVPESPHADARALSFCVASP